MIREYLWLVNFIPTTLTSWLKKMKENKSKFIGVLWSMMVYDLLSLTFTYDVSGVRETHERVLVIKNIGSKTVTDPSVLKFRRIKIHRSIPALVHNTRRLISHPNCKTKLWVLRMGSPSSDLFSGGRRCISTRFYYKCLYLFRKKSDLSGLKWYYILLLSEFSRWIEKFNTTLNVLFYEY